MISITHVLCPIDFSDISHHALTHAAAIAGWYEARLTLLHVFVNLPTMDMPPLVLEDSDRERLLARMRKLAASVPSAVPVDFRIEQAGFAHDEIVAQIEATHADMLVLGTHGRSGFQRLFLGSVTEKVIRKATCPILVVPPRAADAATDAPVQFRRILCPVDFSDSSLHAVAHAIHLAEETDAHLRLLHVVELSPVLSSEFTGVDVDLDRVREATAADAREKLNRLVPEQARTYCTIETTVVAGRAYGEILRQSLEGRADLIVMGVHGHGVFERLVFGSTTHHIIRASTCPVLIVRRGK